MSTRRDVLLGAALALVAGAAYLPALSADFTADDFFILARLRDYGGLADPLAYFRFGFFDYYRPLGFLSHAVDWRLWGLDATGFHLTNVVLHACNTALVYQLGRRLAGAVPSALAALLFGLHAGSHETVYWMAARFDLLATFFVLVSLLALGSARRGAYVVGVGAFACALLSKESAAALPLVAVAWDVIVRRRTWQTTLWRLVPLLAVAAFYALLRSRGADLAADGGRLPKLVLLVGSMGGLLAIARIGVDRVLAAMPGVRLPLAPLWLAGPAAAVLVASRVPGLSGFVLEKLGFAAWVAWVLASPMAFPPAADWRPFLPVTLVEGLPGLIVGLAVLAGLWISRAWLAARPAALFALCFLGAALLPVLSMTGGARYLYLASAGGALLAGLVLAELARRRSALVTGLVAIWLVVSVVELGEAASAWRWAGALSRQAIDAMASEAPGCESRVVVMVTAPVGLRGVYSNLLWDAFSVRTACPPADIATLLRVVGIDAVVTASRPSPETIDLRVPDYRGQIVASADLRRFDVPVPAGSTLAIEMPLGRIDTWPEGAAQRFRVTLAPSAQTPAFFAYGDGAMHALEPGR